MFLDHNGSRTRTARDPHVHIDTVHHRAVHNRAVHNRVARAERPADRDLTRLDLRAALPFLRCRRARRARVVGAGGIERGCGWGRRLADRFDG